MALAETAMLIVQAGGNEAGRRWPLQRGRTVIGRDIDCDIVLPDRLVSRHHAHVVWETLDGREGYIVEDLRSKNGTFVNGQEMTARRMLEDGDEIQIALRFKLAFVDAGETAPLSFDLPSGVERLRLDEDTRQVIVKEQVVDPPLSPAQFRLLALLEIPNAPQVREPVNIKAVIEDAIMALAEEGEQRHVRLSYVGPERPARVLGDRDRLRQVLFNLADNGIKYARVAGGAVVFNVQEQGARLQVRVSDDGVGIPPEVLEHIGEDGYRVSNPASFRRKGSGLGLAIAKRVVKQHGGELRIQSQPGEGTTVFFDLPIYDPAKVSP